MGLRRFVLIRLLISVPMFFIIISTIFIVMRVLPGDPAAAILGVNANPELVAILRHQLGLDKPIGQQYVEFWYDLLRGDLGTSLMYQTPVLKQITQRFPTTIELAIGGTIIGIIIGLGFGIFSATRREQNADYLTRLFAILTYAIPTFWLGMLLQMIFGIYLDILPISGTTSSYMTINRVTGFKLIDGLLAGNTEYIFDSLIHYILPWITLGIWFQSSISRLVRVNMVDVLTEDYINTAKAKGLSNRKIVFKHALRNALLPVLTLMGLQFTGLLGGAVITETVFAIPGLGGLLYFSVLNRDYTMVQGLMVIFTIIIIVGLILIDIIKAYLDPRIRY
jgi:peptide/nickel transport system permease protein